MTLNKKKLKNLSKVYKQLDEQQTPLVTGGITFTRTCCYTTGLCYGTGYVIGDSYS